ncbi:site-specific tyrosine recombinase XerD [Streptococcus sp. X16XC17]|uniref:site-specific tyrosine recombinase XerD n=1 Tax=unclassified Streptococcus TaxID=2608887 RepID=UPI00066FCA82|nr:MULTISPECIES: site-specific tyrosine recombinase XerD [unclassified Streptococcus]TCD46048.1 site-specific tyrosine recombinase XerD [Streptococcus sp. X16XC17]
MKQSYIKIFLEQKEELAEQSKLAYKGDLKQFIEITDGQLSEAKLAIYGAFLGKLKPTAQKRKQSAVNQFLYFLYKENLIDRFYKLDLNVTVKQYSDTSGSQLADLSPLFQSSTAFPKGQLLALLIALMGLSPSQIAELQVADIELDFGIMTVKRDGAKRILAIPKKLLPYLKAHFEKSGPNIYLFDKKGQSYSRQWFFNRLGEFLSEIHQSSWSAQKLREQYILHELKEGRSLEEIAKQLGLKTLVSLEKYK